MNHPNRRKFRSHLVNHGLRLRLVLDDVVFALVAALAAIGILYYLSNREIGDSLWSAHLSIKETKELLDKGVKVAGVVTFLAVLLFGFWSLIDAHRIAGPMHRLRNLLDEIAAGNLNHEIEFRKRDEFQDLAKATDSLVEAYTTRIKNIRRIADSLESAAATLPAPHQAQLTELVGGLKAEMQFFRLPEGDA